MLANVFANLPGTGNGGSIAAKRASKVKKQNHFESTQDDQVALCVGNSPFIGATPVKFTFPAKDWT
jgi:hypothetical protein